MSPRSTDYEADALTITPSRRLFLISHLNFQQCSDPTYYYCQRDLPHLCFFKITSTHQHIKTLQSIYASFRDIKKDVNNFFVYAQNTKQSARGRKYAYFSSTFNSRQILISKQIKQMKSEGAQTYFAPS